MENEHPHPAVSRAALRRRWLKAALITWIISSLGYAFVLGPMIAKSAAIRTSFMPLGYWAPVGMFVPSLAFGLLIAAYTLSPLSHAQLFRPTRARVLGAVGLWFWTPIEALAQMPVIAGYRSALYFFYQMNDRPHSSVDWQLLSNLGALLIASYVVSCLLSSSIPDWRRLTLAYLLIWSESYWLIFAAGAAHRTFLL